MISTFKRQYTFKDLLLIKVENSLKTIAGDYKKGRDNPAHRINDIPLTNEERRRAGSLMRVNHTGEVCAQALYEGQMLVARKPDVRAFLQKSAEEETDHLAWCHERLKELEAHRSYLNILWYWNAFLIGVIAALAGDAYSLGFVEETECQVGQHFQNHFQKLPEDDLKSRAILNQMCEEEAHHGQLAREMGATSLPFFIKPLMKITARIMTTTAYFL
ncbi:MAG TPA: 2-polyprenyl-3-methyl-6-methoxy-1,4-benzoquinone monooxygenase [Coxiellaceae bacterium]|nr:2-polyprenyl-3-methyl-6-methoxy-1,4-benzoquinone monooxygenase [Coxiellaceae bacterium]